MGATSTVSKHSLQDLALGLTSGIVLGVGLLKPWLGGALAFVLALSIAIATACGHHDGRLSGVLGAVKPLRFAPSLAGWRA